MMNRAIAITLASAALLLPASASYAQISGYAGASLGQSDVDVSGFDKATSWQLFGGVNLAKYIGIEAAYTDLGKFDVSGANASVEVDGFEVTAVGNFPINDVVAVFAEAGLYSWNADATVSGTGIGSDDGTDLTYGIGVRIGLTQPLRVHVEYQVYQDVSDADIDTIYAGIAFGF